MSRCLLRISIPSSVAGSPCLVGGGARFKSIASRTAARKQRIRQLQDESSPPDGAPTSPRVHPARQKKVERSFGLAFASSSSSSSSSTPSLPFGLNTPPRPDFAPDLTLTTRQIRQKSNQLEWHDHLDSLPAQAQEEWKRQARIRRKAALLPSDEARQDYYKQVARHQLLSGLGVVEKARFLLEEKLASLGSEEEREEFLLKAEAKRRWERLGITDEGKRNEIEMEQRRLMGLIWEREKVAKTELEGMEEGEEKEARRRELDGQTKQARKERNYVRYEGLGMEVGRPKVVQGEKSESGKETSEVDASKEEKRE